MDTTDTSTPELDLVITDDEPQDEADSFGKEVAKTLLVSTATSAGVFGGFVAIALLTPKVKTWLNRRKNNAVVIEGEVDETKDTPDKE